MGLLLWYGNWSFFRSSSLPTPQNILAELVVILSVLVFQGGVILFVQGLSRNLSEREFKIAGNAASTFLGVALLCGAGFLLFVSVIILTNTPEAEVWAVLFVILAVAGGSLGMIACLRPGFTSDWRPPEVEVFVESEEDLEPHLPPEPNLEALLGVKRKLKAQGRT